jgi:hypothetical protein
MSARAAARLLGLSHQRVLQPTPGEAERYEEAKRGRRTGVPVSDLTTAETLEIMQRISSPLKARPTGSHWVASGQERRQGSS